MAEARYAVVKYVPDLLKQEPRNIGIFVQWHGQTHARFVGETRPGRIDRRMLRGRIIEPEVYEQWVSFWRKEIAKRDVYDPVARQETDTAAPAFFHYLVHMSKGNFMVADGGTIMKASDDDAADDLLSFLYTTMVSEEGFQGAIASAVHDTEPEHGSLRVDVSGTLEKLGILARPGEELIHPRYVIPDSEIMGTLPMPHRPDFVQQSGKIYAMAAADFTLAQKTLQQDHAGAAAFIFGDLRLAHGNAVKTIAIVRGNSGEDRRVKWAVTVLRKQADQFVNWDDKGTRNEFLEERIRLAQ